MAKVQGNGEVIAIKALLERDADFIRASVQAALEAALEAEMTETLGRRRANGARPGWATGPATTIRSLITRVGTLELRVPQDRAGRFSTELFERYQRAEWMARDGGRCWRWSWPTARAGRAGESSVSPGDGRLADASGPLI